MTSYILRRLLLMLPTLLGVSLICFTLIQFVPGGPVEEVISKVRAFESSRGAVAKSISAEEIENIKAYFGFDKPAPIRYLEWLGNICRGDFGNSYVYQQPVLEVIASKIPISLFFGLTGFILAYSISIPLGVAKAKRHGSAFDITSSITIFAGYVIPGYALGILLIIFFAGGSYFDWFPLGGSVSDDFESLPPIGKALDFLHHAALPLVCFTIGDFAVLTMLMKNSLLDELNKDYIRTAMAKGLSFSAAVRRQAFRNALIPVATGLGSVLAVMFATSMLVERVFDIDGTGLLFYNSILGRDYNVVLGLIVITSLIAMLGRLLSDIVYVLIDPRIRFD